MAIVVRNTNYNGEVLEQLLTLAATGNELVEKGLIMVIPGVEKKISLPRLKSGKMLQKRKENPGVEDSKGNFNYDEKSLEPKDFMAFTVFNPRAFEQIWRKWQPKGNLVFAELPPEAQNALLAELAKQVQFELGDQYVNGTYGEDDDHLFNGILTQMAKDTEVIISDSKETTMLGKLKAVRSLIPKAIRNNPKLRILMSIDDFDKYDDELTEREAKNASETDVNAQRYKGIKIETLAAWPDGLIVATLCSQGADGNLFAAVNLQDDEDVIQIDKIANASELYFFKMLMKADTNIAFGEETVVLDSRENPVFKPAQQSISVEPTSVEIPAEDGSIRGITKWCGKPLTEQQQADYKAGKTIRLENVTDKQGQHAIMYVKFNPEKGRPYRYDENPDNAKKVAPSNESRTQVAVNSEGKTNEATKNIKEPLQQGQSAPKDDAQQQQEKPKKNKGMKV